MNVTEGFFQQGISVGRRIGLAAFVTAVLTSCTSLTQEEEATLGAEQVAEIASTTPLLVGTEAVDYIDQLAARLLAVAPENSPAMTFRLIDSKAFSAFTVADGNIYLTAGTILACRNISELASILSHEIAHVSLGHISDTYRRFRASQVTASITGITLAIATGNPFLAGAGDLAANLGSSVYIGSHTREREREADDLAFTIMRQAGFDPRSQLTLLARLRASTLELETPPPFLMTHPAPVERMRDVEERLQLYPFETGLIINDQGKLEAVQQGLL